jgi:hypothetical protein
MSVHLNCGIVNIFRLKIQQTGHKVWTGDIAFEIIENKLYNFRIIQSSAKSDIIS